MARLAPFLNKLALLVETVAEDIAGWNEVGDAFEVLDQERFKTELKKYYKGSLDTFIRQLHFYKFKKFNSERNIRIAKAKKLGLTPPKYEAHANAFSFSHEYFHRDHPELMKNITRFDGKKSKNAATREEMNDLKRQVLSLEDKVSSLSTQLEEAMAMIAQLTAGQQPVLTPRAAEQPVVALDETMSPKVAPKSDIFDGYKRKNRDTVDIEMIDEDLFSSFDLQEDLMLTENDIFDTIPNDKMDVEIGLANTLKRSVSFDNEQEQLPKKILKTTNAAPEMDPKDVSKVVMYLRAAISEASKMAIENVNNKNSNSALVPVNNNAEQLIPLLLSLPQIQSVLCKLQNQQSNTELSIKPMLTQVSF